MQFSRTERGFGVLEHEGYPPGKGLLRLAQHSSAIGPYPDSFDRPGTSYLWIGRDHHLDREEVAELIRHLSAWVETGTLELPTKEKTP